MQPPSVVSDKSEWPPDYVNVFQWRHEQYEEMRKSPKLMWGAVNYYSTRPVEWICHWFDTHDPRNATADLPTRLPLVLFKRQAEMIECILECLRDQEGMLIDKSRDVGATWVCSALSVWLWRYHPGATICWGSRDERNVDKIGDPKSIFEKMRMAIRGMPKFFWPRGFAPNDHMMHLRFINPENGATITGESGSNQGRGGRSTIYFKDESAHYEQAVAIEAAISQNTRVQIDMSTPNGVGTVFDRKRNVAEEWFPRQNRLPPGRTRLFILDWSDHPGKTQEWHDTQEKKWRDDGLLHIFRQEVDRNAAASLEGVICPAEWVNASIDAHLKLSFGPEGGWGGALDIADEGGDLNALTFRKGVTLRYAQDWGEGDTGVTTRRAIDEAMKHRPVSIQYDSAGGYGSNVKAESNRLSKERDSQGQPLLPRDIRFVPWNAGAVVLRPDERIIKGDINSPINKDFYSNLKAQAWWALRRRFEKTYRAINEGIKFDPSELISLDSKLPRLLQIKRELSQPTHARDGRLRLVVDKKPDGARSPNLADSIVMNYFPLSVSSMISPQALTRARLERRR